VEKGETLAVIAAKYAVPVSSLEEKNRGVIYRGRVATGSKLYIPFEDNPHWNTVELEKQLPDEGPGSTSVYQGDMPHFQWPVMGSVSSPFGGRHGRPHEGIDIAARRGTAVRASRSGHVLYSGSGINGYGNLVIIKHADQYATVYAHLQSRSVKKGQFISRGQILGRVGSTGHATGPHLHFEVRSQRTPVNPLSFLHGQVASR
jgi:murein DD-endopeptidase MepM/ murein hydrolase activator NlpD